MESCEQNESYYDEKVKTALDYLNHSGLSKDLIEEGVLLSEVRNGAYEMLKKLHKTKYTHLKNDFFLESEKDWQSTDLVPYYSEVAKVFDFECFGIKSSICVLLDEEIIKNLDGLKADGLKAKSSITYSDKIADNHFVNFFAMKDLVSEYEEENFEYKEFWEAVLEKKKYFNKVAMQIVLTLTQNLEQSIKDDFIQKEELTFLEVVKTTQEIREDLEKYYYLAYTNQKEYKVNEIKNDLIKLNVDLLNVLKFE